MISRMMRSWSAGVTIGVGEQAPMPPVFGPRSPSRARLWSWEVAGGGGRRAEGAETGGGEAVDEAERQGQLGADDGEIDPALLREAQKPLHVVGGDRHALRVLGDAGVAGRAVERGDARALPELPHERVLAPAGGDDGDAQQWRKWRTPVKTMATPGPSAARMAPPSRVLP